MVKRVAYSNFMNEKTKIKVEYFGYDFLDRKKLFYYNKQVRGGASRLQKSKT